MVRPERKPPLRYLSLMRASETSQVVYCCKALTMRSSFVILADVDVVILVMCCWGCC